MPRYKMTIEYDGADFAGWQTQPDTRTVQGEIEKCLAWQLRKQVRITGAGRTDAGVHALGQVAHFDTGENISDDLCHRLNSALPKDLCIRRIEPAADDFHARYSAVRKTYRYRILRIRSAFSYNRAWLPEGELDWKKIEEASEYIVGTHDFGGFCLAESRKENNQCTVESARWDLRGREVAFEITADRFLHRMVRLLVGTLVDIGRGRWAANHIAVVIRTGDVRLAGPAAPARGLYLVHVEYA